MKYIKYSTVEPSFTYSSIYILLIYVLFVLNALLSIRTQIWYTYFTKRTQIQYTYYPK